MKKKILVLGGFGFIGTNILKHIDANYKNDYDVIVLSRNIEHIHGEKFNSVCKVYVGDFSDEILLKSIFEENEINLIIHSLSSTVPSSSANAIYDINSNLLPCIELLNLMVSYNVLDIVFISSGGAIYGLTKNNHPNHESENTFPISSYGVVKLTIEKYLFQYAHLYGIKPLVLRLSNPYGKYHYSKRQGISNVALNAAITKDKFNVWGTGEGFKDYIYVEDFCDILFQLYRKSIHSKILNVGSGSVFSLNEILYKIKDIVPDFTWNYIEASKFDVNHFELDITNLHNIIGKYSFTPFEVGLLHVKDWIIKK